MDSVLDIWATDIPSTPEDRDLNDAVGSGLPDTLRTTAVYRPERRFAVGGQGEVLAARQDELDRLVALKRIRPDRLHAEARRRFQREAAITARLQHPGIVPVYGVGQDDDGPFYTMPLIKGHTLQEAIDGFHRDETLRRNPGEQSLKLRSLLQQFITVCNTVAYAHDQGVVHRDLKPSNIVLGPYGETLVMDWGLAKRIGGDDSAAASDGDVPSPSPSPDDLTATGAVLGTPQYMSPEQARGEPAGPPSDIFSLGLILYALMTGKPAFDADSLRGADPLKAVREAAIVAPRNRDARLSRALEAVCLKALALAPAARYESAEMLKADIERWLADEPVTAWREPLALRARRWARRNRTAITGAAAALVVGVIGLSAVAVVQTRASSALRAKNLQLTKANAATTEAKNEAEAALAETTKAKKETEAALAQERAALAQSKESRQRAEAVLTFLEHDVLAATRPEGQEGGLDKDVTVRKAVDAAEAKIAQRFKDQPAVEAEVRSTLGITYYHLGDPALAIRQFERALELLRIKLGPDDPDTLTSRNNLAMAYLAAGRTAEAINLNEGTLKLRESHLGPDHPATLESRNNLALAYRAAGRAVEAIKVHEATLKLFESKLGRDHPDTLTSRNNLATAYWSAGRTAEAITMNEATLKLRESKLGPDHPDTLTSRNNLGNAYRTAGRTAEAIKLHEGTLKRREAKLGADHPDTIVSRFNLATAYWSAGRTAEAITLNEETLKLRESKLGPDHPHTLLSRSNLATAYEWLGRWADAEALRHTQVRRRKAGKHDSPLLASDLAVLGSNLLSQEKWAHAEPVLRECLAIREKALPDDWSRFSTMSQLGGSLLGQGRYAEAEPLIVAGYEGMKARESKIPAARKPLLAEAELRVVQLFESWGKAAQANAWKTKLGFADLPDDVFARP